MKFSIIIPAHNRSKYIKKIIKRFQKVNDVEIIIVENGSDDKNKKAYKEIQKEYINNESVSFNFNEGMTAQKARKIGVSISNGDWMFFCDDDDRPTDELIEWMNESKLEKNKIYTFDFKNKNGWTWYPPKILNEHFINYNMHVSSAIIDGKLAKMAYESEEMPLDIVLGEDQILMSFMYQSAIKLNYSIISTGIFSIDFAYYEVNNSITRGKREIDADLMINKWLIKQERSNVNMMLFEKMVTSRLRDNNNGIYEGDKIENEKKIATIEQQYFIKNK